MTHHHKPAQSTELAHFQQRAKEKVVYGDGEFAAAGKGEGELEYDEALERALDGEGSDGGGDLRGLECEDPGKKTRIRVWNSIHRYVYLFYGRRVLITSLNSIDSRARKTPPLSFRPLFLSFHRQ